MPLPDIMIKLSDLRQRVREIAPPEGNDYHQRTSADGWAFLGYAQHRLGLDYSTSVFEMFKRHCRLNGENIINATSIVAPEDANYVYTIWTCIEFLRALRKPDSVRWLMNILEDIGMYKNGMQRYCDTEIDLEVPNVTSAAALLYAWDGQTGIASRLVDLLRARQQDGNWWYVIHSTGELYKPEDSFHLAMMIYHLREIQSSGIQTGDLLDPALDALWTMNRLELDPGSIGWGYAMTYLAVVRLSKSFAGRAYAATLEHGLTHDNFRTRALSAWALAKGLR